MTGSSDGPSAAEILESHYERVTGSAAQFAAKVSPDGSSPALFAVLHRDYPRAGAMTGFTMGLSNTHSPASEGHPHRELVICMADDDSAWALAAAYLAVQLRGRCGFDCGDTINFREQIAPSSRMSAFLVVHPTVLNAADAQVDQGFRVVSLRQLIPLYEEERAWIMDGVRTGCCWNGSHPMSS